VPAAAQAPTTAPLALSNRQLRLVQRTALAVAPPQRDAFLHAVARHLTAEPSDYAVQAALNAQLDRLPNEDA
jgi:hypothetical protein